jgi:hypothetical protein
VEQHVAKAGPKNSAAAFRSLEAELAALYSYEHQTTEAAAKAKAQIATVEARIKAICNLVHPDEPRYAERFIRLFSNRLRSSGDFVEYGQLSNHILSRLTEISEEKHRQASEDHRRRRAVEKSGRNKQMAEEFQSKKSNSHSHKSDSALKAEIGKHFGLNRSASIEAINRGLKSLGKQR